MKIFIDNCITIKNRGSELWKVVNKEGVERKRMIGSCLSHHAQRIIRCMLYVCCAIFFLHWFSYINLWYTILRTFPQSIRCTIRSFSFDSLEVPMDYIILLFLSPAFMAIGIWLHG